MYFNYRNIFSHFTTLTCDLPLFVFYVYLKEIIIAGNMEEGGFLWIQTGWWWGNFSELGVGVDRPQVKLLIDIT